MSVDYDQASRGYDETRRFDADVIDALVARATLSARSKVLDFGCGTGNYLAELDRRFSCECYGVDPSPGMRAIAKRKNLRLLIRDGDHRQIPFGDTKFDLIYMTDVIHHVPDVSQLFAQICPRLSERGLLCIVTESRAQVAARFYNGYFPSLKGTETGRYPDLEGLVAVARRSGLEHLANESLPNLAERTIDAEFIETVATKNFSMFHSLSTTEFERGLAAIIADQGRTFPPAGAGKTLVWFRPA
ncbi:MAG: methyltransferase domain-containing protein [Myxococcota bacterium]